jgi:lysozyme
VIDISHYQTIPSFPDAFQKIKDDGIIAVIHKATQSSGMVDSKYTRVLGFKEIGFLIGAYHYMTCRNRDGEAEANFFMDTVAAEDNPDILLALDFEDNGYNCTVRQAELFVKTVFERTGKYPLFYTGLSKISMNTVSKDSILAKCPLWWARYGSRPKIPYAWSDFTLWQYTCKAKINGINGDVDRNYFISDDVNEIYKLWGVTNPEALEAK